jgi:aldose 1-epimerase
MNDHGRKPRSGDQYELSAHGYVAEIASVGATLRAVRYEGRDLILPFDADEVRPAMRGALLAPWPNRTADGRYTFEGVAHQLMRSEFETGNAAHGLVAWLDFICVERTTERVALTATIEPQPGYPLRVRVDAVFALDADGLQQRIVATNESGDAAPFGLGGHPYLTVGRVTARAIDECVLELNADEVLLVSTDRMLPTGIAKVETYEGGRFDFRRPRRLGAASVNNAFTSLRRDADGRARARLTNGAGRGVEISWDERCPWVQVYTADAPGSGEHRSGLAVEPMTCPPDALNSQRDLLVIAPGASVSAGWRIRAV